MTKIFSAIRRKAFSLGLLTTILLLATACESPVAVVEGDTTIEAEPPVLTPRDPSPGNTVCDPFGGGSAQRHLGLKGEIYYLPSDQSYSRVIDYVQNGARLDATLFLNKINVPTRKFDDGFVTTAGEVLKTPAGNTLYEWFALRLDSSLKLAPTDPSGAYQFAILADDGAVMKAKVDGAWKTLVDNDGTHGSRFKVSREPVSFNAATELPIELQYYQGPRYHIAFTLLWRPWPASNEWQDPMDGQTGNDLYFDYNERPSAPKPAWQGILARGWRVIDAANFALPAGAPENNCPPPSEEEEPAANPTLFAITGFDATTGTNNIAIIWQTVGTPSTSRVRYGLSEGNLDRSADLGSSMATVHTMGISGLLPGTAYYLQAESTNSAGDTVRSGVIRKVTK
jgi:hypothetical protein